MVTLGTIAGRQVKSRTLTSKGHVDSLGNEEHVVAVIRK